MTTIDDPRYFRWAPPREAAHVLGISERALRFRAQAGTIERRRDGAQTTYRIPTGLPAAHPRQGRAVAGGQPRLAAGDLRHIVEALVAAERRAVVAEIEAEQLRAQLAQVRAAAAALEAAHIKRAGVIRDLAEQLRATRAAAA